LQKNEIRRPKLKVKRNGSQIFFFKKNYSAKAFMIHFSLRCFPISVLILLFLKLYILVQNFIFFPLFTTLQNTFN
jgi:hypothetical protein